MNGRRKPYYKKAHYRRCAHGNYILKDGEYIESSPGEGNFVKVKGTSVGADQFPVYPLIGDSEEIPIDRMAGKAGK